MTTKKSGLGRGLSALLESNSTDSTQHPKSNQNNSVGSVSLIPHSEIDVNPFQPRTQFDQQALEELSESIKTYGLIQPLTLRKMGYGKYQLISGERRFRASQLAGLKEVPAYIRIANDQEMLEMALVENIQRENLDAIEIALSYQRLIEECKLTQEEMSQRVGKQRSTITNYLRLLKLPAEIQLAIRKKILSMGHAKILLGVDSDDLKITIFEDIIKNDLSVRELEEVIKDFSKITPVTKRKSAKVNAPLAYSIQKLNNELIQKLNAKVEIKRKNSGKGSIIIPFNSDHDLERIVKLFSTNS